MKNEMTKERTLFFFFFLFFGGELLLSCTGLGRLPRKFADCVSVTINKRSFETFMCLDLVLERQQSFLFQILFSLKCSPEADLRAYSVVDSKQLRFLCPDTIVSYMTVRQCTMFKTGKEHATSRHSAFVTYVTDETPWDKDGYQRQTTPKLQLERATVSHSFLGRRHAKMADLGILQQHP